MASIERTITCEGKAFVEATDTYLPALRYTPQPISLAIQLSTLFIIENIEVWDFCAIYKAWMRSAVYPD